MTVVSRQMTSWWIILCLVEQTAPMLVLADTVDFSSPHQGVSGNDTLAKLRTLFVLHVTRNCSVSVLGCAGLYLAILGFTGQYQT